MEQFRFILKKYFPEALPEVQPSAKPLSRTLSLHILRDTYSRSSARSVRKLLRAELIPRLKQPSQPQTVQPPRRETRVKKLYKCQQKEKSFWAKIKQFKDEAALFRETQGQQCHSAQPALQAKTHHQRGQSMDRSSGQFDKAKGQPTNSTNTSLKAVGQQIILALEEYRQQRDQARSGCDTGERALEMGNRVLQLRMRANQCLKPGLQDYFMGLSRDPPPLFLNCLASHQLFESYLVEGSSFDPDKLNDSPVENPSLLLALKLVGRRNFRDIVKLFDQPFANGTGVYSVWLYDRQRGWVQHSVKYSALHLSREAWPLVLESAFQLVNACELGDYLAGMLGCRVYRLAISTANMASILSSVYFRFLVLACSRTECVVVGDAREVTIEGERRVKLQLQHLGGQTEWVDFQDLVPRFSYLVVAEHIPEYCLWEEAIYQTSGGRVDLVANFDRELQLFLAVQFLRNREQQQSLKLTVLKETKNGFWSKVNGCMLRAEGVAEMKLKGRAYYKLQLEGVPGPVNLRLMASARFRPPTQRQRQGELRGTFVTAKSVLGRGQNEGG